MVSVPRRRLILIATLLLSFLLPLTSQAASSACDRSVYYILRGQYDAALRQLEGARTSGSSPAEVENLRGLALMMEGNAKGAMEAFDRALAAEPGLEAARMNRAVALLRSGEPAKASAELARIWANESSPLRAQAAYHHGIALDRLGQPAEAETWLGRAVAIDSSLDAALLYTGALRERRGDLQGAARSYLGYLKSHPQSTAAMLRLGISAQKAGRIDVAKLYLQRVITAAPDSTEAAEARKFLVMWE